MKKCAQKKCEPKSVGLKPKRDNLSSHIKGIVSGPLPVGVGTIKVAGRGWKGGLPGDGGKKLKRTKERLGREEHRFLQKKGKKRKRLQKKNACLVERMYAMGEQSVKKEQSLWPLGW